MSTVTCGTCGDRHQCAETQFTHCGLPMRYQDFFGIRRYICAHRGYHSAVYVNLSTGQTLSEENVPYVDQEAHDA